MSTPPVPRSAEELNKEYQQIGSEVVNAQYALYLHQRKLSELNDKMYAINQEFLARQKLDQEAKKNEASNEQP